MTSVSASINYPSKAPPAEDDSPNRALYEVQPVISYGWLPPQRHVNRVAVSVPRGHGVGPGCRGPCQFLGTQCSCLLHFPPSFSPNPVFITMLLKMSILKRSS